MIVHGDLHVPPGLDQVARQADVLLARRRVAARMVVDDDQRRCSQGYRPGDDFPNVDRGLVDRALPERLIGEQHVLGVEEQHAHLLDP